MSRRRKITLAVACTAPANMSDRDVERVVDRLLNIGYDDAERTITKREGDLDAAREVTRITISEPTAMVEGVGGKPTVATHDETVRTLRTEVARQAAIIAEVHAWAVCAAITTLEDMAQNFPHIVAITGHAQAGVERDKRVVPEDDLTPGGMG